MVEDRVFEFVNEMDVGRARQIQQSLRKVRDQLQTEMRNGSEFISVNGRLYRYGFVSLNDDRTRELLKRMFSDDLGEFREMFFPVESWDDVTSLKVKSHLQGLKNREKILEKLPVSFDSVDDQSLRWLKGIYLTLPTLNKHWDTEFESWGDVSISDDVHPLIEELTGENMEDLGEMLKNLTSHALTFEPRDTNFDKVEEALRVAKKTEKGGKENHGKVELVFARIAASQDRDPQDVYLLLLRYLSQSLKKGSFSPLPPGFQRSSSQNDDIRSFLEEHYTSDDQIVRDWGTKDPVKHIPVTTVPSFPEFKSLVQSL